MLRLSRKSVSHDMVADIKIKHIWEKTFCFSIYVRPYAAYQCWGSVTFWCGSGSPDPYLWLIDPDPVPDPTPDPTHFFINLRIIKIKKISYFFLLSCIQAHHFQSNKFNFYYNLVFKCYFAGIISVRSTHLWEKGRVRCQIRIRSSD